MFSNPMKLAWAFLFVGIALFAFSGQGAVQAFEAPTATDTVSPTNQSAAPAVATATLTPTATVEKPTATSTTAATATTEKPTATSTTEATATTEKATATFTPVPSTNTPTATHTPQAATATPTLKATATTTSTVETATVTPTVEISVTVTPTKAATETVTPTAQTTATVTPTITATPTPTATLKAPARALSPSAGTVASVSTSFVVQNADPSTDANVSATFYDTNGVVSGTLTTVISPNMSTTFDQRDPSGLPGSPSTYQGSVVLSSNTQLASVVNEFAGSSTALGKSFRSESYSSFSSSDVDTQILMPQLLKNVFDTGTNTNYNSMLAIQNASLAISATVTITYYDQWAPFGIYTHTLPPISPGASAFVDLQNEMVGLNPAVDQFYGSGVITSDQPVAVLVHHNGAGVLNIYHGFTRAEASQTIFFPQLLKNVYDSGNQMTWQTSVIVMSVDQTPANVTLTYNNFGNTIVNRQVANPSATIDQRYDPNLPGYVFATAVLTADKPVVAIVPFFTNYDSVRGLRHAYYRAFATGTGSSKMFAPIVMKNHYDAGTNASWSTGLVGQVMGNISTTLTITYYIPGIAPRQSSVTVDPSKNRLFQFDTRFDPVLNNLSTVYGSAVIESNPPTEFSFVMDEIGSASVMGDAETKYSGIP